MNYKFHHKTLGKISVTWDPKFDEYVVAQIGKDGCYTADWPLPASPPRGNPITGFNIRSQSKFEEGVVLVDFHNVPFFWRQEINPSAKPWDQQRPGILKALEAIGCPAVGEDALSLPGHATSIKMPVNKLKDFVVELGKQMEGL